MNSEIPLQNLSLPQPNLQSTSESLVTTSNMQSIVDRTSAFEIFRKSYRKNQIIEENKNILRNKYAQAKQLGETVNNYRNSIASLKAQLEKRHVEVGMQALAAGNANVQGIIILVVFVLFCTIDVFLRICF